MKWYSESTNTEVDIEEMHDNYLKNAIRKAENNLPYFPYNPKPVVIKLYEQALKRKIITDEEYTNKINLLEEAE